MQIIINYIFFCYKNTKIIWMVPCDIIAALNIKGIVINDNTDKLFVFILIQFINILKFKPNKIKF